MHPNYTSNGDSVSDTAWTDTNAGMRSERELRWSDSAGIASGMGSSERSWSCTAVGDIEHDAGFSAERGLH